VENSAVDFYRDTAAHKKETADSSSDARRILARNDKVGQSHVLRTSGVKTPDFSRLFGTAEAVP
jgi:hypothetical protein